MEDYKTEDGRIKRKWICMNFDCQVVVMFCLPRPENDAGSRECPVCKHYMIKETFSGDLPLYAAGDKKNGIQNI
jgi:hypothetical protein